MPPKSDPAQALGQLMAKIQKKVDPDITILCGTDVHRVHSLVLEDASAFFDKICNGPFKESHTREINLVEDHSEAVKAFVEFLYNGNYGAELQHGEGDTQPGDDGLHLHARVYYFALKYDIEKLAWAAHTKFSDELKLNEMREQPADKIADLVRFVYTFDIIEKADSVRHSVCAMFMSRMHLLDSSEAKQAMLDCPEFSRDLILKWRYWPINQVVVPCHSNLCGGLLRCSISCSQCGLPPKDLGRYPVSFSPLTVDDPRRATTRTTRGLRAQMWG